MFSLFASLSFSALCPPTGVTGVTTCSNNDIVVSWNPSPEIGVNYDVRSLEDGGAGANFSTTQTSHALTGLRCGELYSLAVAARDDECTSVSSAPLLTETGSYVENGNQKTKSISLH